MEQTNLELVVTQEDGKWIGRIIQLPDVTATGATKEACMENLKAALAPYFKEVARQALNKGLKKLK